MSIREHLKDARSLVRALRADGLPIKTAPVYGLPAGVFTGLDDGGTLSIREHEGRAYAERHNTYGRLVRRYWLE